MHAMTYYNLQYLASEPACWQVVYVDDDMLNIIFHKRSMYDHFGNLWYFARVFTFSPAMELCKQRH